MSLEWAAAWAQIIASSGAVVVGVVATIVGLRIASRERAASQERWRKDREEGRERWLQDREESRDRWLRDREESRDRWLQDHAESHEQWVRDQQLRAYIQFDDSFMQWQRLRRARVAIVFPRVQRQWQSAMSSLELLGSTRVRRKVYAVLTLADAARRSPIDGDAWQDFATGVDSLRGLMQDEMRISSVEPDRSQYIEQLRRRVLGVDATILRHYFSAHR